MLRKLSHILTLLVGIFLVTACTKWTALPYDHANLKETNGNSWGRPEMRPIAWGYSGIPKECGKENPECKIEK